jgi:hypothetical protein
VIRSLPLALAAVALAAPVAAADRAHPEVVELFQSQGCSSCPPANANVMAIAARPEVLALAFQVTYWDQLGWKDTFAHPAFTGRQWDYARAWKRPNVATPQVVVNGRRDLIGSDRADLERALKSADRGAGGPAVTVAGARATVESAPGAPTADVWLVRYDPRVVQVPIQRGENGGKTLPHRNVVRELVRLGGWSGQAASFDLPAAKDAALRTAVLVQAGPGGPILAAARG